jgi:aspartate/methionine/tyrosine aminotransferase
MVITTHGGTGANSIVCHALAEEGKNVIVVAPCYQQFVSIPSALGCEVREYMCDESSGYGLNLDDLAKLVDQNTKAIFLTNPSNPTGYTLSREELEGLVEIARRVNAYVVCDEIYRGLDEEYMPSICDLYERGISTGGTSKVFSSAGARVGWIVTRDLSLVPTLNNFRSYNSICEGPINELIAATILEHKDVFLARSRNIAINGTRELEKWIKGEPHFQIVRESHGSTSFLTYDFDVPTKKYA